MFIFISNNIVFESCDCRLFCVLVLVFIVDCKVFWLLVRLVKLIFKWFSLFWFVFWLFLIVFIMLDKVFFFLWRWCWMLIILDWLRVKLVIVICMVFNVFIRFWLLWLCFVFNVVMFSKVFLIWVEMFWKCFGVVL